MTWAGAGFGFQRRLDGEEVGVLVDGVYVHKVGSEVWDEDVLLGWVEDCFVWMGCVLTARDGPRPGQGVCEDLGRGDVAGRGYVVGLESASGTMVEEGLVSGLVRQMCLTSRICLLEALNVVLGMHWEEAEGRMKEAVAVSY
jgi:hypothetical protein